MHAFDDLQYVTLNATKKEKGEGTTKAEWTKEE